MDRWTAPIALGLTLALAPTSAFAQRKIQDAKNTSTEEAAPFEDPELEQFAVYEQSAPLPETVDRVETSLPLELRQGDRIAFVGGTLFDRMNDFGYFETGVQQSFPGLQLEFRNLAWSADEVDLQPRPDNFGTLDQHLNYYDADVIIAAFGYNESFAGPEGLPAFKDKLRTYVQKITTSAYNDQSAPQLVLVTPVANEDIDNVAAATRNNANIKAYAQAIEDVAEEQGVASVDLYTPTQKAFADPNNDHTFNGAHLLDVGYRLVADSLFEDLFNQAPEEPREDIRQVVLDKNEQFRYRYRPVNTFYYTGGRNEQYGYLDFLPAMRNFDIMVANRDRKIWDMASSEPATTPVTIDDSNVPPLPRTKQSRGANEWLSPEEELKAFQVDPRFEVNLFASEEEFPDIAAPIQMRWDAQGRLWVSCSTTYPHVYPGQAPSDKLVILEDTDGDGKADKSSVFADDLHIPLSFELGDGGVYVSEEPDLTFIKDTDGDGKADFRRKLLTSFGTEDSHHALHDFVWTPEGDLLFRESIFLHSQVETPYGPVRARNSSWFVFEPDIHRLSAFGAYPNTNPWGVTFDTWGNHVASHPIFATAFHATNPPYPDQHPRATGIPAYSGTCGQEFIDFPTFPEELQGAFVKVRYKPTNRVEIHQWIENADHFAEHYHSDLIFSTNLSFIPVDVRFGPRGALYICDWYNPVKGHAQYSLRDERRDRKSGRIWRVTAKDIPLQDPPKVHGAPVKDLLNLLERNEYRYRYWAKRELRDRPADSVEPALRAWTQSLATPETLDRKAQLEALWMYRNIGARNDALLQELLACENRHVRAAAARVLRSWGKDLENVDTWIQKLANDENQLVRMEAAIAASYLGTRGALDSMLDVLSQPMGSHLRYSIRTALGSENLSRIWGDSNFPPAQREQIETFMDDWSSFSQLEAGLTTRSATEANFDSQPNLQDITIKTVPARMLFDITEFEVPAGAPVKLSLINPDETAHNLVIVQPGAAEEVGIAGNEMAKDPNGIKKHYVPESDKILHATKLLSPHTSETLRFIAPEKPGKYPYICTYPGHWVIMRGVMIVK